MTVNTVLQVGTVHVVFWAWCVTLTVLARLNLDSSPDHVADVEGSSGKVGDMGLIEDQGYLLVGFCVREEVLWSTKREKREFWRGMSVIELRV